MKTIYFEKRMVKKSIEDINSMINENAESKTGISLEYIPEEELGCYEDSQKFINKHCGCDFYLAVKTMATGTEDVLSMMAVEF